MTLQNRVNPWGVIEAVPAHGTMLGNRGGKFHKPDKTLGKRRWATHHWICCELHYKDMHHEPMGNGYTSLFFLDEVTALAAGHRPCFFCRRREAKAFLGGRKVDEFDRQLHEERIRRSFPLGEGEFPTGAIVEIGGLAYAVKDQLLLPWSHFGYSPAIPRNAAMYGRLLTPPSITAILAGGYQPRWHESALQGDNT